MILQAISYIFQAISAMITNMNTLMIDEYVSLLSFVITCIVVIIVIRVIGGLIRHNGNS